MREENRAGFLGINVQMETKRGEEVERQTGRQTEREREKVPDKLYVLLSFH